MEKNIFSKQQSRLWQNMLQLIEDYRKGIINYYDFVGKLEGVFDAGDFRGNDIARDWYDCWIPLEIARAQNENLDNGIVDKYILTMEEHLKSIMDKGYLSVDDN